jgi:(2Fe-2S) ferredoxin
MTETEERGSPRQVLICQGRTCRRLGSSQVLDAFRAEPVPGVEIVGGGCLGQCGNGPMVLVMPEQVWYWQVRAKEVPLIIEQHLRSSHSVTPMLYPKFHRRSSN